jgi:hypothetical protein
MDRPSTGEFYIGLRSSECWPTRDVRYNGSGKRMRRSFKAHPTEWVKRILCIVQTRDEAARIEAVLVTQREVDNPLCLNQCGGGTGGSTGFTEQGLVRLSSSKKELWKDPVHRLKMSAKRSAWHNSNPERSKYVVDVWHSPEVRKKAIKGMIASRSPLSDLDVQAVRLLHAKGYKTGWLARTFECHRSTILRAYSGQTRKEVL